MGAEGAIKPRSGLIYDPLQQHNNPKCGCMQLRLHVQPHKSAAEFTALFTSGRVFQACQVFQLFNDKAHVISALKAPSELKMSPWTNSKLNLESYDPI